MVVQSEHAQAMGLQGGSLGSRVRFRACLGACVAIAAGAFAPVASAQSPSVVFSATGAEQAYVVTPGVSLVSVEAIGAPGGGGCGGAAGGLGARVTAELAVSPGSVLMSKWGLPERPVCFRAASAPPARPASSTAEVRSGSWAPAAAAAPRTSVRCPQR